MNSVGTKTDDATYGSFISAIRSGVGSFDGFSMSSTSPAVVRIRYRTLGAVTINERSNSRSSRSWTISMCSVPRNPQRNPRSEEHTSELQSLAYLVCRLLLEKKKKSRH